MKLLERARMFLEGEGIPFAENFIDVAVDTLARRLCVEAFQVTDNDPASEWINNTLLPANRFDGLQQTVHVETPKLGDGFVIGDVGPDGNPRFSWNRPHIVKAVYSDDGDELLYAVKRWPSNVKGISNPDGKTIWRMNIYFPDRIEKWFAVDKDGEVWAEWMEPDPNPEVDAPRWPTPWLDRDDEPLDVCVFHFRNNPQGGRLGRSEVRGAVPFQRELNKQALDLFYVMDGQGWKQRWATGIPDDTSIQVAIGEYLKATSDTAKFGEFDAEDPKPMVEAMFATLKRMSAKCSVPLQELIADSTVSGESRKASELGQVSKAEDFQTANGHTWIAMARAGWRIADTFSEDTDAPEYDPDATIEVSWEQAATRDEILEAQTYESYLRLGVSKKTILRRLGFDPDEEAEARQEEGDAMAAALLRDFDRNQNGAGA
jgi:hypothetical protein